MNSVTSVISARLSRAALSVPGTLLATMALATSPAPADYDLAWMAGCWSYDGRNAGSVEQWMAPVDGELVGMSRIVSDNKMVAFEFMLIARNPDGRLEFVASPSGQKTARFQLASLDQHEVEFENPGHDFPMTRTACDAP